ncbi:MAG: dockerin type I domain-containing protein [Phycisphaerae bacterium]
MAHLLLEVGDPMIVSSTGTAVSLKKTEPAVPGAPLKTGFPALRDSIPLRAWTILTHIPSGTSVRLGYLPADVNGNRASTATDVLALVDGLNKVGDPLAIYQMDINRSGVANATDILRVIDLLNGAGVYDVWNGATLPD